MSVSLSHGLWVWFLALFFFLTFLILVFSVAVPPILMGFLALGVAVFLFVRIGQNEPPA